MTMQPYFQVGDLALTFSPESSVSIDEDFYVSVWGLVHPELGELLSGYESDTKVGFRLRYQGIHRRGVPTGQAHFEAGRSSNFDHYLWDDGWAYALEFTGSAVLDGGWLEMRGQLAPNYGDSEGAEVKLRWPLPLDGLDWTAYRFGSLPETEGADPLSVTRLDLVDLDSESLPTRVLDFRNLRSFRLRCSPETFHKGQSLPLAQLDEGIGELVHLEDLHVHSASLTSVPAALGRLQALKWLQISHCRLQSTPAELWALPSLHRLDLSHNALASLPESVQLGNLTDLDLAHNQLTTLPAALAQLPRLRRISLEGNPLDSLPPAFGDIELELPLADKMRLLDYSYPGAGGRGLVEWDESMYRAASLPPGSPEPLRCLALHSLAFRHLDSQEGAVVGGTRFGGWPDLPVGQAYPRYLMEEDEYHYEFIAQLNCAELVGLQGYLPRTGRLYFFLSNIHEMQPLVLYHETSELVDGASLQLTAEMFFDTWEVPYPGFPVAVTAFTSLPSTYAASSNPHLFEGEAAALADEEELIERLREEQSPPGRHEVNCHVFTQHESPQLQAALKYRGHPRDWLVLLKVASTGGFQWGDAGELFYVIHKSDLARRDFSAVFCTSESS